MTEGSRRKTVHVKFLVVLVAIMSIQALAKLSEADQELLDTAWNVSPEQVTGECGFLQTTTRPDEYEDTRYLEEKIRFDPSKEGEDAWELESVDGALPSVEALSEFRPERQGVYFDLLNSQFDLTGASFHEDKGDIRTFKVPLQKTESIPAGMAKKLTGYIDIDVPTSTLRAAKIRVEKPFRFRVFMKVDKFNQTFLFDVDAEVNRFVLREMSMDMKMSALGQSHEMTLSVKYSDFECALDETGLNSQT